MEINNPLIIKFTTDYLPLIRHAHRYIAFYNHIYSDHIKGNAYFEVIQNGILAIYKSFENFLVLISPKTKDYKIIHNLSTNFVFAGIVRSNFPPDGLVIKAECVIPDANKIIQSVIQYFQRISPYIQIFPKDAKNFIILFKNFQGLVDYVSYLFINVPEH